MSNYKNDLKKVMILYPELIVKSSQDYIDLINIHNIAESAFRNNFDSTIVKKAFESRDVFPKIKNANDYFYLLFLTTTAGKGLKKVAYPSMGNKEVKDEYDIDKWAKLVYKIYDAVGSGDMDMHSAIDYYSSTLDTSKEEDEKFKKWVSYYQNGEHLKYSQDDNISKVAYQFSISPPADPYSTNANGVSSTGIKDRIQNIQTLFNSAEDLSKEKEAAKKNKEHYKGWKNKLHTAIRRIDKLLRQSEEFVDMDSQKELADLLHKFDQEVRGLKHEVTASDLAFKYANKFKKLGFEPGYSEFRKFAQDAAAVAPPAEAPTAPTTPAAPVAPAATPATTEAAPGAEQAAKTEAAGETDRGQTPLERALSPIAETKEGEYESLAGDVDLGDAITKLEDIAGRLSDRRTIRLLAEFDIILDKIGIAPMFPELAEAQSKLIDAYSYALTRVTKMLGMLSSGKSIFEISDVKKKELIGKTMKELNRTEEAAGEVSAPAEEKKGPEKTQEGLNEAGLAGGGEAAAPAPVPAEAPAEPKA